MQYNIEDLERRLGLAVEGESTTSAELETTQGRLEEESAALAAMSTALDDKAAELLVSQVMAKRFFRLIVESIAYIKLHSRLDNA
jgi:hypothetical protein